jgi:hypothetical protein
MSRNKSASQAWRARRARAAARARWAAVTDKSAATAAARRAFSQRFTLQPDPAAARRDFYADLGRRSARARAARKAVAG